MKKNQFIWVLISALCILCVECKKDNCNSKQLDDKNFTASELNVVPYNGSETLVFKNEVGDSMIFYGEGRTSTMIPRVANPDHDEDECAGDYRNSESNITKFRHGIDTIMSIALGFYRPFGDNENVKNIHFSYGKEDLNYSYFHGNYSFYNNSSNQDTLICLNDYGYDYYFINNYYGTVTLENKTYSRVYELTFFNSFGRTLFYSTVQGIVGFKEPSGTLWYLDKIQ